MEQQVYVLDACALIAYYQAENGSLIVKDFFKQAANQQIILLIHAASIAEIYYDFLKRKSFPEANEFLKDIQSNLPMQINNVIDEEIIVWMGNIKAIYKVSFADSFVLALAKHKNATVITSDHHEFDTIEKADSINFVWIR